MSTHLYEGGLDGREERCQLFGFEVEGFGGMEEEGEGETAGEQAQRGDVGG